MRLFLIRHGETVDNVAQIYAGTRDSKLTNHGVLQASRLGQHFNECGIQFTHIFSSHLQRAAKTAALIHDGQHGINEAARSVEQGFQINDVPRSKVVSIQPQVLHLPILMEQDFGFYEGRSFQQRPQDSRVSGRRAHEEQHKNDVNFVPPESKESMAERANCFLNGHLVPLLRGEKVESEDTVAVVSHGMLLSSLWRCLLHRFPTKSVNFAPEVLGSQPFVDLEHLGAWSNTGYLELSLSRIQSITIDEGSAAVQSLGARTDPEKSAVSSEQRFASTATTSNNATTDSTIAGVPSIPETRRAKMSPVRPISQPGASESTPTLQKSGEVLEGWTVVVRTVNGKAHLRGLKRTGGGVGSAKFEEGQKTLETFFKRRKVD